jgi:hypothetical protein
MSAVRPLKLFSAANMKLRLSAYAFLASLAVLTSIGSVGLGLILIAGSSLHGEPIGGPYGILQAPVFAAVGSLLALLFVAVPVCFVLRWFFEKNNWSKRSRWLFIPFTGPAFFPVLAPVFFLLGEHDIFLAIVWSFIFGVVVSTYWLAYLIFDHLLTKRPPNQPPALPTPSGSGSP